MQETRRIGIGLTLLSIVGYAIGVAAPYPGRAVTLVGVMVGVTLYAIDGEGGESE